ncbi:MAG: hypothetical protein NE327_15815 [Lentisphaeraceae bacterium]|nr:hypothetical protein [Lentisphaeraceae bacterium]
MKFTNIISICAIILSAVAIGLSSVGGSPQIKSELSEDRVREIIRQELAQLDFDPEEQSSAVSAKVKSGPVSKKVTDKAVRKLVANEVQDQIEDLVESGEISKLVKENEFNQNERVDVSHLDTSEEKIKFILSKFDGIDSFFGESEVLEQLREFGDEGIPFLIEGMKKSGRNWGGSWAATNALTGMLREDHKDIILENFDKNSTFPELILKYNFPEAEEMVFKKIEKVSNYIDENIIEAALDYDSVRAEDSIREYITRGQSVSSAAEALLARNPGIDIKDELREAARRCDEPWSKAQLSNVLIGQGMNEGIGLALDAYESSDNSYMKNETLKSIRKSVSFSGSTNELIQYLRDNKDSLTWDAKSRKFQ